ncbi:hypothetical protein H4R21_001955 [Coemansia helicoidea]|uniref:Uncharacterized protein n=1 Tax=Coemansia helicoidea TaxID=1286919 RepID=A0ACC1L901_9FUNG|nr:hypothetical protein H4R21_001955 [Coemansia helicoidea]
MAEDIARLLVRSPSVATREDFGVCVPLGGRIADVKAAIERGHEASPPARSMRLIWKGRILEDSDPVAAMYGSGTAAEPQTVHFVLNPPDTPTAPTVPSAPAAAMGQRPASSGGVGGDGDAGEGCSSAAATGSGPAMVPLGSQFQYVLVDGAPHLLVQPADSGAGRQWAIAPLVPQGDDSELASRQAMDDRLAGLKARRDMLFQEMHRARERAAESRRIAQETRERADEARARADEARARAAQAPQNGVPLMGILRGDGLGAVGSFLWMLLRILLVVLLFAHDARPSRLLALACVITGFALARSEWVRSHLEYLFGHWPQEPPEDAPHDRQYSALEKARALVLALVSSLMPAEPFQLPVGDE